MRRKDRSGRRKEKKEGGEGRERRNKMEWEEEEGEGGGREKTKRMEWEGEGKEGGGEGKEGGERVRRRRTERKGRWGEKVYQMTKESHILVKKIPLWVSQSTVCQRSSCSNMDMQPLIALTSNVSNIQCSNESACTTHSTHPSMKYSDLIVTEQFEALLLVSMLKLKWRALSVRQNSRQ